MRKLIVAAFTSLDGVMQAPGGPEEDTDGGFAHGGWLVPHVDEVFGAAMGELFSRPFELLLGRRTYDIFAAHWPRVPADSGDAGMAELLSGVVKHVATHRPDTLAWQNSRGLGEDVVATVRELKRQDGPDLLTQGSSQLVHRLLATDLVDELRLLVFPVLLGEGKRLFPDEGEAAAFRLVESVASPNGILISRYLRAGEVRTGSFALE
ncbi:dihydrofolate reductase family protein [Luteimonas sp. RD2P54]|uniref:Dihydrofolate reductase family protein n=1 Tax=Luteimonas endophytica TaxID=3042023 RepID=A0ABT6J7X1_9GAMM|nr:dihydrofolate reductase family protein [Luteimonas endophytica]MDH5822844.1 dihydrofolate reductase family protein [Luteimonas endophytica]